MGERFTARRYTQEGGGGEDRKGPLDDIKHTLLLSPLCRMGLRVEIGPFPPLVVGPIRGTRGRKQGNNTRKEQGGKGRVEMKVYTHTSINLYVILIGG